MRGASHGSPPTANELKKFGWTIGGVFFALGLLFLLSYLIKGEISILFPVVFLAAGAFLILMGSLPAARESALMRAIHRGWMGLAGFLGKYVGHYVGMVIFTIIYWVLFTPVSLIARMVGFDPLGLRKYRQVDSYWHEREAALTSDHYEKQYDIKQHPPAEDSSNGT